MAGSLTRHSTTSTFRVHRRYRLYLATGEDATKHVGGIGSIAEKLRIRNLRSIAGVTSPAA